jgi:hypothetical protein
MNCHTRKLRLVFRYRLAGLASAVGLCTLIVGCGRLAGPNSPRAASAAATSVASSVPTLAPSPTGVAINCSTPSNRQDAGLAYLPGRAEAVLFGGFDQVALRGDADTWTWSLGCWVQRQPTHSPAAYRSAALALDAAAGRVIAYLGEGDDPGQEQATWSWDGADWTKVATGPTTHWAGAPDSAIAYDASRKQVVLYGLVSQAGATQTWTWNGAAWVAMNPRHSPPERLRSSMAYDATTHRIILFGGVSTAGSVYQHLGDTWAWDGTDWSQLSPAHSPSPRQSATLVAHAASSRILLIGGAAETDLSDSWAWDGADWLSIPSPGSRNGASAADLGPQVLLFGGTAGSAASTYTWDGERWSGS